MGNIMDEKPKKAKKAPRIKHKKLIILFTAILVVATVFIIKAFSSKHYALAEETESFEIERPKTGNPLDYTGKDNAAICNWVIRHTNGFKSVTTGTVKAKVSFINYNQELKNTRIVTSDGCYIETISDSSLVHVYEEKYLENDQIVVRKNHSDKYTTITKDVFLEKYGWHPTDFQAYILNEETIVEATIEEYDGNYKLSLILDPVKSSPRKQRETKTIGGAKGYPGYKTTELTIILTSDWTPIEVDTYEVYDIGMPGIGDVTCKCNMVELFEYGEFEIPDKDLFKEHITDEATDIDDTEKDVIGYLQEIFGPLIQGNMNDFDITVDALDTKLEGDLNINLGLASGVGVNANIDGIFVKYEGDMVYIKLGENKYKVNIKKLMSYLSDGTSSNKDAFDLNSIISQVQESQIIKNNDSLTIKMNLDLMGIKANVDINAKIVNDTYEFKDIYAKVDAFGKIIILTMKPSTPYKYPAIDSTYQDISNIGFIASEVKKLVNKPLEIDLTTTIKDYTIKANAVYKNGLASGLITVNDKYEINVYYNNETIYLTYNNLYFKLNINDINSLIDTNIELPEISIKLKDILDIIKTLNIKMNGAKAFDLAIDLTKYTDLLKDSKINVDASNGLTITIDSMDLTLNVKEATNEVEVNPDVEYNDIKNVKWLIDTVKEAINYEAYSFDIDLTYNDLTVKGNVYLDKNLTVSATIDLKYQDYEFKNVKFDYVDNVAYISFYNIKVSSTIEELVEVIGEMPVLDIDKLINALSLTLNESNLFVGLDLTSFEGILNKFGNVGLLINNDKSVNVTTDLINANIKFSSATIKDITINSEDYIALEDLEWLIDDIKNAIEFDAYNFNISAQYKDLLIDGNIYLNKDLEVEANLNINYSGLLLNDVLVMYKNNEVYLKYGNTTIKLNLNDIDGIIAEINKAFDLNISTDSLNVEFDLNTILSTITLNALDEKVIITANLDSISSALGNVKVEVSKGLLVKLSNTDIKLDAKLTNVDYKEIELPNASINKDEIYLLIEYASQLKEIIEKWRYNIGFELHVNGYDIYAKVNIVTFKPNAGLSLYGKLVIFKGSNEYYAEASIINNEAYLNFSQTITNKNNTNPINSTTSQSIKFRISFDELIEVANYAIDKLEIDNDTIKMAINYLGKIVDTNGVFDDLFAEAKDKVKSIDLSMINDFIDLSQLGLFVDNDNLTIDLGVNSLGNNSSISIYREDGQIKGLNTVDFEINNDILNSHFELLADENISNANYSGCLNFNGVGDLIKAVVDNYKHGEIAISGKVSMSLLGFNLSASVTIDAKLDFDYNGKIRGYIGLDIKKLGIDILGLLIKNDTKTYIYIQDDMIYLKRTINSTSTRKMSLSDFGKDIKEQIVWIFNFGSTVADQIINAEPVDVKIEEVLTAYSGKNNSYSVTLDGAKLVGSNAFNDINLTLTTTKTNNELYLSSIKAEATLISALDISAPLTVASITSPIDWNSFFPSEATLNGFTTYNIN